MAQKGNRTPLCEQTSDISKSNNNNKTQIIDKNVHSNNSSLGNSRRRAVENFIIAWLNPDMDESNEATQKSISDLRRVVNSVKIFSNADRCIMFVSDVRDEKVFVIVSGTINPLFISLIADKSQLASIYLIGNDENELQQWTAHHPKIKGAFMKLEDLCNHLKNDVRQRENDLMSISIISSSSETNLNALDPSFMYSQLLSEILLQDVSTLQKKKDFIDFCRYSYEDNSRELKVINELEQKYPNPSLIWWYTRDCFVHSMLNKALRTQDIEVIMKMGFIIRDLHRNIEQIHQEQNRQEPLFVYRRQGMSHAEFNLIKKSKGGLLAFNSFLSTSTNPDVALSFAKDSRNSSDFTAIFFRIHIDPKMSTTPFVSVDQEHGYFKDREKEILFSMHTVCRIGETEEIENRIFQVNLTLTNDNDPQLTQLIEHIRQATQGPSGLHRMGQLMCYMSELDRAEEVYTTLSEIIPDDDRQQLSLLHHQLGYIKKQKNDLTSALSHYEKSLDIKSTYLSSDDPQLSPTHCNIACVLQDQGDLDGALEHLKYALKIDLRAPKPDQLGIATRYNNIGSVLEDQGNYEETLISYERALEIQIARLPLQNPSVATTYNNIGLLYRKMGDNTSALSFYQKTLEIFERTLPAHHPSLAVSHHNMAMVLFDLHETKKAIVHAEKALNITRHTFGHTHPNTQRRQAYFDELRRSL